MRKKEEESTNNENEEPETMEKPTLEETKKEKATDSKTPDDMRADIGEQSGYKRLVDLRGIGPKTVEKLNENGYKTIVDLATARADEVAALLKITYGQAKAWVNEASEAVLLRMETIDAVDYDNELKSKVIYFKTGSSNVNELFGRWHCAEDGLTLKAGQKCQLCGKLPIFTGGGIPTTSSSGASGRFASGKTQIGNDIIIDALSKFTCPKCYTILNEGAKCEVCGSEAKAVEVAFVETEQDTVHLDRLREIYGNRKLDNRNLPKINWHNLHICPARQIPTVKAQFLQYKVIQRKIDNGCNIHLVIVDSFNAKFRPGYSRSEMLPIRAREFAEHFNLIDYMASQYNLAWYLTCQVIAPPRPDQGLAMKVKFADSYYPVGGDSILHSINNWVGLTQMKTNLWEANTFDSSWIPRGSANFMLTAKGLINAVE